MLHLYYFSYHLCCPTSLIHSSDIPGAYSGFPKIFTASKSAVQTCYQLSLHLVMHPPQEKPPLILVGLAIFPSFSINVFMVGCIFWLRVLMRWANPKLNSLMHAWSVTVLLFPRSRNMATVILFLNFGKHILLCVST